MPESKTAASREDSLAERRFGVLEAQFGVPKERTSAKGFGSRALTVGGKMFACLYKGELLLKLPEERVDALVSSGLGNPLSARGKRPMREWVSVPPAVEADWLALAEEARTFVRSQAKPAAQAADPDGSEP